jgi:hypothetical protein
MTSETGASTSARHDVFDIESDEGTAQGSVQNDSVRDCRFVFVRPCGFGDLGLVIFLQFGNGLILARNDTPRAVLGGGELGEQHL